MSRKLILLCSVVVDDEVIRKIKTLRTLKEIGELATPEFENRKQRIMGEGNLGVNLHGEEEVRFQRYAAPHQRCV